MPGRAVSSAADREPGEAPDDHVLAGLGRQRRAELLDRLAAVLVLVDVLLAQQDDLVEPLVDLAGDDPLAHVLGPVGGLLGGDPLLALAVLGRDTSSSVTASGVAAAMCSARSRANSMNFSLRATKSVWQSTSTSTPILLPAWM